MKKLLLSIFTLLSLGAFSQDNLGINTGNYSGITGISLQPANVADSRYKFDINLVSASINFDNNYLGFTRNYFLNNRFSFKDFNSYQDFKSRILIENDLKGKDAYFNLNNRIQLPSFMLTTGKKSGIALNIQNRTSIALQNVDAGFAKQVYEFWKYQPTQGQFYDVSGMKMNAMNWLEVGLTYGRVVLDKNKHFVKIGITPKYLGGLSSWNMDAKDLHIKADRDSFMTAYGSNINYSRSNSDISTKINSNYRPDASSIGGDIGVVYEFRGRIDKFKFLKYNKKNDEIDNTTRRDKNKYSFKIGASLVDVGRLKYKSAPLARNFSINSNDFNMWSLDIRNIKQFDTVISQNVNYTGAANQEFSVALPTALSAQIDLHLIKGFYVNAMGYMPFTAFNKKTDFRIPTPKYYAVTPRWESRMAGVYVPFVFNEHNELSAGASLRVGPAFIGTSNFLTLLKKDNISSADLHAGVKIAIAHGKPSKASKWLNSVKNKVTATETKIENKQVELKSTETNVTENRTIIIDTIISNDGKKVEIEKVIIKEMPIQNKDSKTQEKPTNTQPIQIIINNYNSGSTPANQSHLKSNSVENIEIQENNINVDELNDLQMQIELLKLKLKQKELLIEELEKSQLEINSNSSSTESKKKIDSLRFAYLYDTIVNANTASFSSNASLSQQKQRLFVLMNDLNRLQVKDAVLNGKLKDNEKKLNSLILVEQKNSNKNALSELQSLKSQYVVLQHAQPNLTSIKKLELIQPNTVKANNTNTAVIAKEASTSSINVDGSAYLSKSMYESLKKELAELKGEMKRLNIHNEELLAKTEKLSMSMNKSTNTIVPIVSKNKQVVDVKLIHDTIYIEKAPKEKIVERIVRDTITNTIEKNNTITRVEQKIEYINNDRANLLELEPEVILFDNGQSLVKGIYFSKLKSLASKAIKFPELKFHLKGHTDNVGDPAKNLILSMKRAEAVQNYLISRGINKSNIIIESSGANDPIADNTSASGKSQNRRVEVKVMEN